MKYDAMYQYYADQTVLPTYAGFKSLGELQKYGNQRCKFFTEKIFCPPQMFQNAEVLEIGPDSGENSLVFANWGAYLTLVEPNPNAHPHIKNYFKRFGLSNHLKELTETDLEGFRSRREKCCDILDAEGFIYTIQPMSVWLSSFYHLLRNDGFFIISYYERFGGFVELCLKAVHKAVLELTGLPPMEAAWLIYKNKWNSIPHTRAFESWVMDVLENPFVRLSYFLGANYLYSQAVDHGFSLYSSWPSYRDSLIPYWHKKILPVTEQLHQDKRHIMRSCLSYLLGRKMYLILRDDKQVYSINTKLIQLVTDVDRLIDGPDGTVLKRFSEGLDWIDSLIDSNNVLVDSMDEISKARNIIRSIQQVFALIQNRDSASIRSFTNSSQPFIGIWGMPTHFAVFRKIGD